MKDKEKRITEAKNMKKTSLMKDRVFEAAIHLFNSKGYAETSVRDIASLAKANVSTISYYFNGKEGLLEHSFLVFIEPYLKEIENGIKELEEIGAKETLTKIIIRLMDYQYNHKTLSRLIWREVSVDRQIIRELMSTYFMKERALLQEIFHTGINNGEFKKISPSLAIVQLKGMMSSPFLNSIYTKEVWSINFQDRYYFDKYKEQLIFWVNSTISN